MIAETKVMECAYCGKVKAWPRSFINHYFAECTECYEKRERKDKMISDMIPYFWYMAGSLCFAIGTGIVIYRMIKGV